MFRGQRDEMLYVGKATNLRQRVRSYFGSDDRRKIGPMLRETQSVSHLDLPDALTAEVIESRLISSLLPRYNRAGTRADKYCYVKLDVDSAWPRLSVVKNPSAKGLHLGPLPSRTMANLVVEAIQTARTVASLHGQDGSRLRAARRCPGLQRRSTRRGPVPVFRDRGSCRLRHCRRRGSQRVGGRSAHRDRPARATACSTSPRTSGSRRQR